MGAESGREVGHLIVGGDETLQNPVANLFFPVILPRGQVPLRGGHIQQEGIHDSRNGACELACPAPKKNSGNRAKENLEIQPERPLVDILQIEPDPVGKIGHFVAPGNLPETGHSRRDAEASPLGVGSHGDRFGAGKKARDRGIQV